MLTTARPDEIVCVNYSNANKSISLSPTEIGTAYLSATVASCSIAVGLSRLVPRLRGLQPATRALLGKLIPFASVASAGVVNIGLMRWKEVRDGQFCLSSLSSSFPAHSSPRFPFSSWPSADVGLRLRSCTLGISIFPPSDPETGKTSPTVLGQSSIAGAHAIGQTAASRVFTNM